METRWGPTAGRTGLGGCLALWGGVPDWPWGDFVVDGRGGMSFGLRGAPGGRSLPVVVFDGEQGEDGHGVVDLTGAGHVDGFG